MLRCYAWGEWSRSQSAMMLLKSNSKFLCVTPPHRHIRPILTCGKEFGQNETIEEKYINYYHLDNTLIINVLHTSTVGAGFIPVLAAAWYLLGILSVAAAGQLLCILSVAVRAGINPATTAAECCNDLTIKQLCCFLFYNSVLRPTSETYKCSGWEKWSRGQLAIMLLKSNQKFLCATPPHKADNDMRRGSRPKWDYRVKIYYIIIYYYIILIINTLKYN